MAYRKVEESSLTAVADAIRARSGSSGALEFPDGFVEAVGALPVGGAVTSVNGQTGAVQLSAADVGALSADTLPGAVDDALAQAKASGEFDGEKGDKGDPGEIGPTGPQGDPGEPGYTPIKGIDYFDGQPGKDGVSVTHEWDGAVLKITSASGTSSADLKGDSGTDGKDGYTPQKGVDYFDGAPGAKGDPGEIGPTGPKGDKGEKGADGYTPVRGVDYWTEEDQEAITEEVSNQLSLKLADELAKRGQLKPEFANSIEDCTDTSKLYVLPDGYIYAYSYIERPAYTNLADPTSADWLPNKRFSSGNIVDFANNPDVIVTNPIPCKAGDTIRMRGVNLETNISSSKPRTYFYNDKSVLTGDEQIYYQPWDVISNGYGTWDNATKTATFRLVNPTTGSAVTWTFDNIRANIRLASGFTANDVIITVNQEIVDGDVKDYAWANTGHAFVPADYEDRIISLEKTEADHESRLKLLEADEDSAGVPDYWLEHMREKAESIQQAMEAAGRNKSAFLWYTDAHWPNSAKVSPALLDYLVRNTPMNKVNFGGDIVGDPASFTHENIKYVYEWRKAIAGLPNHHSVPGNHDLYHNQADVRNMAYAFLIAPEESPDMVVGGELYYYIDNPAEKTRYLYLDYGTAEPAQFIVDAIKGVQDDWHIVAIAHRWFQYTAAATPTAGSVPAYEAEILSVFDAYNAKTGRGASAYFGALDFSGAKGKVEFCVGGHIHVDHDFTSDGGIPIIITASDTNQERSSSETEDAGTLGTTTEAAVYGIVADYANSKISVIGVGRGGSREITISKDS